jgi:Xaa-Pro aminopeptidase
MGIAQRVEALRQRLQEEGLDGLLVSTPENRRYLSDFTGHDDRADSAGVLLVGRDDAALITDGRYAVLAANDCPQLRAIVRVGPMAPAAVEAAREMGVRRLGFEAAHMTVALRDDMAAHAQEHAIPLELVATRRVVEAQRVRKDAEEIAAIEHAVAVTDATFDHLLTYIRPGMTEQQVAREIERYMLEQGAEGCAFPPIVASGPNAALPHAVPTSRPLVPGEMIIIDMGALWDGYCSDLTRTICLGQPPADIRAAYDDVMHAQRACAEGVRAGMTGPEADALARDELAAAGRGEQYVHGTGHGLGLEIHEDPWLTRYETGPALAPGMIFTIEPGAYVAGWGGVRIEDTVLLTTDGLRVLTRSPKELRVPLRRPRRAHAASGVIE